MNSGIALWSTDIAAYTFTAGNNGTLSGLGINCQWGSGPDTQTLVSKEATRHNQSFFSTANDALFTQIKMTAGAGSGEIVQNGGSVGGYSNKAFVINAITGKMIVGSFTDELWFGPETSSVPFGRFTSTGSFGVNTTPDASAIADIASTTKGFLIPRMTGAQAEAIVLPATGLLVYSTDGSGIIINAAGWWGFDGITWNKLN